MRTSFAHTHNITRLLSKTWYASLMPFFRATPSQYLVVGPGNFQQQLQHYAHWQIHKVKSYPLIKFLSASPSANTSWSTPHTLSSRSFDYIICAAHHTRSCGQHADGNGLSEMMRELEMWLGTVKKMTVTNSNLVYQSSASIFDLFDVLSIFKTEKYIASLCPTVYPTTLFRW